MVLDLILVSFGDLGGTFSDFRGYRERGRDRGRDRDRAPLDHPWLRALSQLVVSDRLVGHSKQLPTTSLPTCKQLKADTRLANWQLQTGGLERTGKPDCQLVIERTGGTWEQ